MTTKHPEKHPENRHRGQEENQPQGHRKPADQKAREAEAKHRTDMEDLKEEVDNEAKLRAAYAKPEVQMNVVRHHLRRLWKGLGIAEIPQDLSADFDNKLDPETNALLRGQPVQSEVIREKSGPAGAYVDEEDRDFRQGLTDAAMRYRGGGPEEGPTDQPNRLEP